MINHSDILQLCRLCLVEEKVNHPIFEEAGDLRSIFLKITSCLPISIREDDSLPKNICDSCSSKLDSFYQFWNETANAEKQLLQWLKESALTPLSQTVQTETIKNKMDTTEVKEEIDVIENKVDAVEMSSEAQTYILQQQQLPYSSTPPKILPTLNETDEPAPKRPKRASAMKAMEQMESEDDDDEDFGAENYTKSESENSDKEDGTYPEGPSTSMDDQPGPSGMGKGSTDAPYNQFASECFPVENFEIKAERYDDEEDEKIIITVISDCESDIDFNTDFYCDFDKDFVINRNLVHTQSTENKSTNKKLDSSQLCHICGLMVSRMKSHMKRHSRNFSCPLCANKYKNHKDLEKHMTYHENNIYNCQFCGLSFATSLELSKHNRNHYNAYKCIYCPFMSTYVGSITNHVKLHENKIKFQCDMCCRRFSTEYLMETHKQIHTGIKRYQCDFCTKRFTTVNYKNCHMRYNHTEELTGVKAVYRCHVCYREFSFEKSLVRHLSVIHDIGESKKVECPICRKVIANNFNLKMHMTVHTGEKTHVCELCGKAFRDRGHLKRHNKVHAKRALFY